MTTARDIRNQIQYGVEQQLGQAVTEAKEVSFAEGHESGLAEGRAEGREEGEKIGEARGIEETKLATARTMLTMNYPIEDISKITGLSIESIKNLK